MPSSAVWLSCALTRTPTEVRRKWKLLHAQTPMSASLAKKRRQKISLSVSEEGGGSPTKMEAKTMREEVGRVMARVLRYEDIQSVRYTQNDLNITLREMTRFQYSDEGVCCRPRSETFSKSEEAQRRGSCVSCRKTINTFSCVAAVGKTGILSVNCGRRTKNAKADGWCVEEEINGEDNLARWREDERQDNTDWWSSEHLAK